MLGQILRATGLEDVDGLGACGPQFVERRTLRISRLHHLGNAFDRPVRELLHLAAANFARAPGGAVCFRRITRGAPTIAPGAHAAATDAGGARGAVIGVRPVDAVVDVVVGIGPEVVIGIRPVHVIEQVVMGVGPEQRSEPAEDEPATPPRPGRAGESAVESRRPESRLQSDVGNGAIAEHPVTQMPAAAVSGKSCAVFAATVSAAMSDKACPVPAATMFGTMPAATMFGTMPAATMFATVPAATMPAAAVPPPPCPPPPCPPPPCPPPPPFASASSVIRGTTRSSIAAKQAPVVNTSFAALRDWARRTAAVG